MSDERKLMKRDAQGRVVVPVARREALLDEFERSGQCGAEFARHAGVKYIDQLNEAGASIHFTQGWGGNSFMTELSGRLSYRHGKHSLPRLFRGFHVMAGPWVSMGGSRGTFFPPNFWKF